MLWCMELSRVIDELAARPVEGRDGESLRVGLLELAWAGQRLEALKAAWLGAWVGSGAWASDGSRAPGARLARDAHRDPKVARAEVRRAKRLVSMPVTCAAFAAGRIAVEHVDKLCSANQPVLANAFAEAEQMLVAWAIDFDDFDVFASSVDSWIQAADDDQAEERAERARDGRRASCSRTLGGRREVQATLDPIGGAIVENELFRLERLLFHEDWAAAEAIHGEATQLDHLQRTSAQRRADALVLMAERSAAMQPDAKAGRVLVSILVDYETAAGRLCELMDGTVITPGELTRYLDRAWMERLVFSGRNRVIEVGAQVPFYVGVLRRAIEVRDRVCQFPGCREPAERCDVDHIVERCDGGPTTQANGRLLCPTHNRQRPGRRRTAPNPGDSRSEDDPDPPDVESPSS